MYSFRTILVILIVVQELIKEYTEFISAKNAILSIPEYLLLVFLIQHSPKKNASRVIFTLSVIQLLILLEW